MSDILFWQYFESWINMYKKNNIRDVTLQKYNAHLQTLKADFPELKLCDMKRVDYQGIIDKYASNHEKVSVGDFHHHLKACLADAVEDGLIERNPALKCSIKGKEKERYPTKFISQFEMQCLIKSLKFGDDIDLNYLVYLIIKTGMRFSEAIAITPKDFSFEKQTISVNKTWNYKKNDGFSPTKNKSSIREIPVDWKTINLFSDKLKGFKDDEPIFLMHYGYIYNSTVNSFLKNKCIEAEIPIISLHALRHSHASILIANGVSVASVSKRLGHSNITTTQEIYLHIIKELENKDNALAIASMMNIDQ